MADRITLPRLSRFKLSGFAPIFKRDIEMSLNGGTYIILGGNGLGKTTIIQAIVYGMAGEAGESIEEQKSLRWNHYYFRDRLDPKAVSSAYVEVEFHLGGSQVGVRRGFNSSAIIGFKLGSAKDWIETPDELQISFNQAILDLGGYKTSADFTFIVHRLLYLAESRRLLAWDSNSQLRTVMLLNQDAVLETSFRRRKRELKEMDSSKRHIHVALGKIIAQLDRFKPTSSPTAGRSSVNPDGLLHRSIEQVQSLSKEIVDSEQREQSLFDNLNQISASIDTTRELIEQAEAALVLQLISQTERQESLPLYKLVELGICPACGTKQLALQTTAHQHLIEGRCLICGSDEAQPAHPELSTLRSQLSELIRAQQTIEGDLRETDGKLEILKRTEYELQLQVNRLRSEIQPFITLIERDLMPTSSKAQLVKIRKSLERQESDLEAQLLRRRVALERDYHRFREAIDGRIEELRQTYSSYATEFLGIPCSLTETPTKHLLSLSRFVPMFNGKARLTPESCSESQQFFLDIAFRLALIDQATVTNDNAATFLCETPENALDMSHLDNVVRMFNQFLDKGHSLFLTSNIQRDSIAKPLLHTIQKARRPAHVVNLLDFGRLGTVHLKALRKLRAVVRRIMG